jgi:uncharacterized membrane protein SpoIIM required for sporulation
VTLKKNVRMSVVTLLMLATRVFCTIPTAVVSHLNVDVSSSSSSSNSCQSGLREDNTNYIYCARQNLTKMPNFFSNGQTISINSANIVTNIIYDELVLTDNLIASLEVDSLSVQLKAKKIYLDNNPLRHIDPRAFEHARNYLEEIYFENKPNMDEPLNGIRIDSDEQQLQPESIDFEQGLMNEPDESSQAAVTELAIFDKAVLQSCLNLRVLSIKNYRLESLPAGKFSRLGKLEVLSLRGDALGVLSERAFVGLENTLVELNLDSNRLSFVPTRSLAPLRRLKRLGLSQNRIKLIHSSAFYPLSALGYLDLSYNRIARIHSSAFDGPIQNSLKSLLMHNNELKWPHLIYLLFNLHMLQILNVDFNRLAVGVGTGVTSEFYKQPLDKLVKVESSIINQKFTNSNRSSFYLKLDSLSMQGNAIDERAVSMLNSAYGYDALIGSGYFTNGNSNRHSNANSLISQSDQYSDTFLTSGSINRVLSANQKQFRYAELKRLNLARNKLKRIEKETFVKLGANQLKELILDKNPLTGFDKHTFNGLHDSLNSLSLSAAGFKLFDYESLKALEQFVQLQHLKLNGNQMGDTGRKNDNLDLNSYQEYSVNKGIFASLLTLELQNNNLNYLSRDICRFSNLISLDLSSNRLSTLEPANCLLFKQNQNASTITTLGTTNLKRLNLNNNPLRCDCRARALKLWLMRTYDPELLELIKWECNEPTELSAKSLVEVGLDELVCHENQQDIKTNSVTTSTLRVRWESEKPPAILVQEESEITSSLESLASSFTSILLNSTIHTYTSNLSQIHQITDLDVSIRPNKDKQEQQEQKKQQHQQQQSIKYGSSKTSSAVTNQKYDEFINMNYYSIIIGCSFGLSFVCLIILLVLYLKFIRYANINEKSSVSSCCDVYARAHEVKSGSPNQYSNNKYEKKQFCSPASTKSSTASSSSDCSTSESHSNTRQTMFSLSVLSAASESAASSLASNLQQRQQQALLVYNSEPSSKQPQLQTLRIHEGASNYFINTYHPSNSYYKSNSNQIASESSNIYELAQEDEFITPTNRLGNLFQCKCDHINQYNSLDFHANFCSSSKKSSCSCSSTSNFGNSEPLVIYSIQNNLSQPSWSKHNNENENHIYHEINTPMNGQFNRKDYLSPQHIGVTNAFTNSLFV